MADFYQWQGDDLILNLRVLPGSSIDGFGEVANNHIKLKIKAEPVDGKANQYLITWLAKTFKVTKKQIVIISGKSGRSKRIKIHSPGHLPDIIIQSSD